MRLFLIFVLMLFPSVVFAQIRIGVYPVELKGNSISSQLKEEIESTIYKNLNIPSQIKVIALNDKVDKNHTQIRYLLKSYIEFSKDETKVELNLLDLLSSRVVYSVKEKVDSSELLSRLAIYCEEIKNRVFSLGNPIDVSSSEEKSFLSKINPLARLDDLFSRFFSKKERFDIKIPIPPPPPPSYNENSYPSPKISYKGDIKNNSSKTFTDNKVYPPSPWQWF